MVVGPLGQAHSDGDAGTVLVQRELQSLDGVDCAGGGGLGSAGHCRCRGFFRLFGCVRGVCYRQMSVE
jgi:hypothetical protein